MTLFQLFLCLLNGLVASPGGSATGIVGVGKEEVVHGMDLERLRQVMAIPWQPQQTRWRLIRQSSPGRHPEPRAIAALLRYAPAELAALGCLQSQAPMLSAEWLSQHQGLIQASHPHLPSPVEGYPLDVRPFVRMGTWEGRALSLPALSSILVELQRPKD